MDLSEVRSIVEEAAPSMREALWLGQWHLSFVYGPCEGGSWSAQCYRKAPYRQAIITIDPARAEDRADVLDSLRHELLHCVVGEFDVYANMVQTNIDVDDGPATAVEERAFALAVERTVNHLECVLDGLGMTPERLASWTGPDHG
jgi:septum formation topological specificity factor MinE